MEPVRPVSGAMRAIFLIGGCFVLVAGAQLYLFSGRTDDFFAWTIEPRLTAAFLGALYFSACVIALGSARERDWDRARAGVPGVIVFVLLMLAATLLHLDKFHLDDDAVIPAAAAWIWLAVYVLEPPFLLWAYSKQLRLAGRDSPCAGAMPGWYGAAALALGVALVAVAVVLFALPDSADDLWPWELTPLTARAIAATLAGEGVVLITISRDRCWVRARWALGGTAVWGGLMAIGLARYPDTVDFTSPAGIAMLAVIAALLAVSAYGLTRVRMPEEGLEPPEPE